VTDLTPHLKIAGIDCFPQNYGFLSRLNALEEMIKNCLSESHILGEAFKLGARELVEV